MKAFCGQLAVDFCFSICMRATVVWFRCVPVSSRQLRSRNHVVVSRARIIFNVNTSAIAAECIKMCGVNDNADAVATRKEKIIKI